MKTGLKYKRIIQKPYCCVPACLLMVLNRRGIQHGSQDEIGFELGLVVPEKDAYLFKEMSIGTMPSSGYGTQIQLRKYSINSYFKKNGINLRERYVAAEKIKNLGKLIEKNIADGNDMLTCFKYDALHGGYQFGHVSLIEKLKDGVITLVDPGNNVPARRKVSVEKLFSAMKVHGKKNRGGMWLIS